MNETNPSIEIARATVKLIGGRSAPIGNAARSWTERRGLVLELRSGQGLVGRGESSPLKGHSAESFDHVERELNHLAQTLEQSRQLSSADDIELSSSAQLAFETARAEIEAKRLGSSIAEVIGNAAAKPIAASQLVAIGENTSALANEVGCVKFKVGPISAWSTQEQAISRFAAARRHCSIRLDFNSTLEVDEATVVANQLRDVPWIAAIDYIEDPGQELAAWKCDWPAALAVDQAVGTATIGTASNGQQALRAVRERGGSVAICKPALCGGLHATFQLARHFNQNGIEPIISHLLDGPIALGAYAELACAIGAWRENPRAAAVGPHGAMAAYGATTFSQFKAGLLHPVIHQHGPR